MPMFVGSQSFISLPSFMFVSAVVSEIRKLKKKEKEKEEKKNSEIDYFQFNTFPGSGGSRGGSLGSDEPPFGSRDSD